MGLFELLKRKKYRRVAERIGLKVIFRFKHGEEKPSSGVLKDISTQGFGFSAAGEMKKGNEIDTEIQVSCKTCDRDHKEIHLKEKAVIKWVSSNRSIKLVDYDAGCEFVGQKNISKKKLATVLRILKSSAKENS